MTAHKKLPLDRLLVERGLARDVQEARALIMAGDVVAGDHRADKPGTRMPADAPLRLKAAAGRYVSRGGDKLAKPLATFRVCVQNKIALDVGASTGGFTDCLLQHGAEKVYAVDVGYGQLAWKLRQDPRVAVLDRTNIRDVTPDMLQPPPALAVIDASFVSLKALLPHAAVLLAGTGEIMALVKPQFEVAKQSVAAGGIVRDEKQYQEVIADLIATVHRLGMLVAGIMESPITGQKGNREFFLYLVRQPP